jgi:hypothetical protein
MLVVADREEPGFASLGADGAGPVGSDGHQRGCPHLPHSRQDGQGGWASGGSAREHCQSWATSAGEVTAGGSGVAGECRECGEESMMGDDEKRPARKVNERVRIRSIEGVRLGVPLAYVQ